MWNTSAFRAAEKGNFEAAVKLGIAYLYNEGRKSTWYWFRIDLLMHLCACMLVHPCLMIDQIKSPSSLMNSTGAFNSIPLLCVSLPALLSDEGRADMCGRKASHFFSLAESLHSPSTNPFIWVFIRPPWSPTGSCCKAVVFDRLKAECDSNMVGELNNECQDYDIEIEKTFGKSFLIIRYSKSKSFVLFFSAGEERTTLALSGPSFAAIWSKCET